MKKLNSKLNLLSQEGGFTLIEMLIVVAIIGILVAIAVPALNTAKSDAQNAKQNAIAASVATAKVRYVLASSAVVPTNTTATFSQISPYLLVNGGTATVGELTLASNNGAGLNMVTFGTYPGPDGTATGVTWTNGTVTPVIQ